MRRVWSVCACTALCAFLPSHLFAQPTPAGRVDVAVGASWLQGYDVGESDGLLTSSQAPTGQPFVLFRTATRLDQAAAVDARIGIVIGGGFSAEVRSSFSRPKYRISISGDSEAAQAIDVIDRIDQYIVDVALVWRIVQLSRGPIFPFIGGGSGYVRQLHSDGVLASDGARYFGNGGVEYWLRRRDSGRLKGAGLRSTVQAAWTETDLDIDNQRRSELSVVADFFLRF